MSVAHRVRASLVAAVLTSGCASHDLYHRYTNKHTSYEEGDPLPTTYYYELPVTILIDVLFFPISIPAYFITCKLQASD